MPKKIGTHNGKFHADEVAAVALLLRVFPDADIVRSRDPRILATCDIVLDVGGVYNPSEDRYDHHQPVGAGEWLDGTKLSSFGLVWKIYGYKFAPHIVVYRTIESLLVIPIDARDNGQQPERRLRDIPSLADFVDALNSAWGEAVDENASFKEAVSFVGRYLDRLLVHTMAEQKATEIVRQAIKAATNPHLIILNQGLPWLKVIVEEAPEAKFVILPGQPESSEWMVQAIPQELGKQQPLRRQLPASWGGLSGPNLIEATGVKDAKFAHNARFIAIANSKEGALALAHLALSS